MRSTYDVSHIKLAHTCLHMASLPLQLLFLFGITENKVPSYYAVK